MMNPKRIIRFSFLLFISCLKRRSRFHIVLTIGNSEVAIIVGRDTIKIFNLFHDDNGKENKVINWREHQRKHGNKYLP